MRCFWSYCMLYFFSLKFACEQFKRKSHGFYSSVVNITTLDLSKRLFFAHTCTYIKSQLVKNSTLEYLWLYILTISSILNNRITYICVGLWWLSKKLSDPNIAHTTHLHKSVKTFSLKKIKKVWHTKDDNIGKFPEAAFWKTSLNDLQKQSHTKGLPLGTFLLVEIWRKH